jgi:hypothetical protein
MPTKKKTPAVSTTRPRVRRQARTSPSLPPPGEIASRAYLLFIGRGGEHGRDLEDWLRAERELQSAEL